jgi:hypothetical protein
VESQNRGCHLKEEMTCDTASCSIIIVVGALIQRSLCVGVGVCVFINRELLRSLKLQSVSWYMEGKPEAAGCCPLTFP